MEEALYFEILRFINNFKGLSRDCLIAMQTKYPSIPAHTLASILCTRYQKKMMTNHGRVKTNKKEAVKRYEERIAAGEEPGLIIRQAKLYDVAPALLAKVIVEETMEKKSKRESNNSKNNQANQITKNMIKDMFKDTNKIPDPDLAYEVFLSIVFDNMYGPISDVTKQSLGVEYEVKLYREVEKVGLPYKTEDQLRARGYDKTPDVKLDTPCAVDGFIINWVESKAVFGDQITHNQYIKDQYHSYWNRFGPGLVIYWFGYVATVPQSTEKRFIVRDKFPENITLMNPSLIQVPKLKLF